MTPEVRRFFFAPSPLIITKANVKSRVHRRAHMDYIGIKTYQDDGRPKGEIRCVGLFTSQAYVSSPSQIPVLRHKVETVLTKPRAIPPASHAGKALLNVLDTFPRDELFQIGAKELQVWAEGILDLETRPRVRVFARVDRFDRFVSVLVYAPRDRLQHRACANSIGAPCLAAYNGRLSAFYPYFPGRPAGPGSVHHRPLRRADAARVDVAELEREIAEIVRTWDDRLADAICGARHSKQISCWPSTGRHFPPATRKPSRPSARSRTSSASSAWAQNTLSSSIFTACPACPRAASTPRSIRWVRRSHSPQRVPVLENLGFSAIDERSYHITPRFEDGERDVALHDMVLETPTAARYRARATRQAARRLLPGRAARARPTTTASIG